MKLPKFLTGTFLNANIHQNFPFALQSRVNPHFHSQSTERSSQNGNMLMATDIHSPMNSERLICGYKDKTDSHSDNGFVTPQMDNSFEVLPLTLQSEIKQNFPNPHFYSHQPQQHIFLDMNSSCGVERFHLREKAGQGEIKSGGVEDYLPRASLDDIHIKSNQMKKRGYYEKRN